MLRSIEKLYNNPLYIVEWAFSTYTNSKQPGK